MSNNDEGVIECDLKHPRTVRSHSVTGPNFTSLHRSYTTQPGEEVMDDPKRRKKLADLQ